MLLDAEKFLSVNSLSKKTLCYLSEEGKRSIMLRLNFREKSKGKR